MIVVWLTGPALLALQPAFLHQGWLHVKLLCVILMSVVHGLYARWRKIFERDGNTRTANFYRFWNEVPTILLLIIVAMAVAKPF
jgi:protoporphyrinogen IX oxidase